MVVLRSLILTQILFPPPIRQFLYNAYGGAVRNHRTSHPLPHATLKPTEPPHHSLTFFLPFFFFLKNDSRPTATARRGTNPTAVVRQSISPEPARRERKLLHENGTPALILSTIYSATPTKQPENPDNSRQNRAPNQRVIYRKTTQIGVIYRKVTPKKPQLSTEKSPLSTGKSRADMSRTASPGRTRLLATLCNEHEDRNIKTVSTNLSRRNTVL